MKAAPPVSIGLPVYNGAQFLGQTLDDLLGQTYGDFELVVCDNASTDETPDLLADAAARDDRVVVVRNRTNIGALPNTNRAFECSHGRRYVLAAHDDRHAPDFLARLVGALDADPEAVLAYGASTLIGDDDRPLDYVPDRELYLDAAGAELRYDRRLQRPLPDDPVARYRAVLGATDMNAPIYGLFQREALERIGPHQIHGSDRLVVAHAALLGRFAFVDAPLFGYRIHSESTVHLTREAWIERDTGTRGSGSRLDGVRTLRRYLAAVADTDLSARQKAQAVRATFGYAVRPQVLARLVLPGPDNYWGWTRWPWEDERVRVSGRDKNAVWTAGPEWVWLQGDREKRNNRVESFD